MDVSHETREVILVADFNPSEVLSKKLARSLVTLVEGSGIRIEVVRERLSDAARACIPGIIRNARRDSDPDHQVEMIAHQAIRQRINARMNVFSIQLEEALVVKLVAEEILAIVAAIVEVVDPACLERNRRLHVGSVRVFGVDPCIPEPRR